MMTIWTDDPQDLRGGLPEEEHEVSPLEEGETVRVVGKPSSELSLRQQFVTIEWMDREFGVPLSQLEPVDASDATEQAVSDWHYWLDR